MKRRIAAWLVAALALAGCGPVAQRGSVESRPVTAASRPTFATQLAGPSTFLAPMPTAVVLLKPDDLNRNRAFCNAFTRRLPTAQAAMAASTTASNLILTRWLVQLADIPAERSTDCDFLVGTYDYARAARLMSTAKLSEGQLTGPGPFLIMVIPDASGIHVAGLDGSTYNSGDFDRFIDAWGSALRTSQDQITRAPDQPGLVTSIFNLVSAVLRTVVGGVGGLIRGVINTL